MFQTHRPGDLNQSHPVDPVSLKQPITAVPHSCFFVCLFIKLFCFVFAMGLSGEKQRERQRQREHSRRGDGHTNGLYLVF